MIIEAFDRKLRIVLSGEEVHNLFGNYDQINYSEPESRKKLNELIGRAFPNTAFFQNTKSVRIDVRPRNGGCSIELTKKKSKYKRLRASSVCLIQFDNSEEMIRAGCRLYRLIHPKNDNSKLYKTKNGYRLQTIIPNNLLEQLRNEYSVTTSKTAIAAAEEYDRIICKNNAVTGLYNAFG